jgi:hypothetical protein
VYTPGNCNIANICGRLFVGILPLDRKIASFGEMWIVIAKQMQKKGLV